MELRRYTEVDAFLADATPFLVEREAEHNLIFGVAGTYREDPGQYTGPAYLATVHDEDRVVAVALRTPPYRLVLSETEDPVAIGLLAQDTLEFELPGVQGPVEVVRAFVREREARGGPPARRALGERVYRLTAVIPPRPVAGSMRVPRVSERDVIATWVHAFMLEALDEDDRPGAEPAADRWIAGRGRSLYAWDVDGELVSLAGVTGPTPNGIRVGPVYTPPEHRGRGYASALVAQVSQAQLDNGRRFVFLFTDAANATANRIYQAIGYELAGDIDEYVYEAAEATDAGH
jgi:predicted GNAT family acetyltransferase